MNIPDHKFLETQPIENINDILGTVIESRKGKSHEHVYLVIKSGQISTTKNKKEASPMKEVLLTLKAISHEIFSDIDKQAISREAVKAFRIHLDNFILTHYLDEKRGFFKDRIRLIMFYVRGFFNLTQEIQNQLDMRMSAYGYKNHPKKVYGENVQYTPNGQIISKTLEYKRTINYEECKIRHEEEEINQFEKIKESVHLDSEDISKAFGIELNKALGKTKWSKGAIRFITESFDHVLEQVVNQVEVGTLSSEQEIKKFHEIFIEYLNSRNRETIELDREMFRDMVGERVIDGIGRSTIEDIDVRSTEFQQLVKDYNDQTWKTGENKSLTLIYMNEEDFSKMNEVLNKVINNQDFKAVIDHLFVNLLTYPVLKKIKAFTQNPNNQNLNTESKRKFLIICFSEFASFIYPRLIKLKLEQKKEQLQNIQHVLLEQLSQSSIKEEDLNLIKEVFEFQFRSF
jgi:hypothetical protein